MMAGAVNATRVRIPGNFPLGYVPSVRRQRLPRRHHPLRADAQRAAAAGDPGAPPVAYADYFSAYVRMVEGARGMGFDGAARTTSTWSGCAAQRGRRCARGRRSASAGTAST
ncbi:hypothetical protein GUJ93_ZPchr0006g42642 [Zizania palustris]|uniref:Uncharacterized protein n=1 Tax=Zizania palustris TaxID=103762 RepID=A0A8J5STZ6_ZIZPA|nr:hypothetical protein GUJ93_ZPchr0006g42642 [Zizania palustris]